MTATTSPTTKIAEHLLARSGKGLISLYMPTHRAGADIWQDPIRFKNLIRSAQHELESTGTPADEVAHLLDPLTAMRYDRKFWQYQGDGLAIFRSPDSLDIFRLPTTVPELCIVGTHFHLKPVLMSLADERTFYVLALSQQHVRLLRGSPHGLTEVQGLDLPEGPEAGKRNSRKPLNSHGAGHGFRVQHASAEPDRKELISAFCREVDREIATVVGAEEPVILAGVDFVVSLFREQTTLKTLSDMSIAGSPDDMTPEALFAKALPIAESHFAKRRMLAENEFHRAVQGGKALDEPLEAFRAARDGRVELLFVPIGVQIWGKTAMQDGDFAINEQRDPEDQDLLNLALIDTWKAGGRVLAVPPTCMPGGRSIAAVVRF